MPPGILTELVLSIKAIIMQLYLGSARKQHRSTLKGSKQKHEVLRFSLRRETPRSHVLNFRATSGHNVVYMHSDVLKEISRFRLLSSGRRHLLLKVPNVRQCTSFSKTNKAVLLEFPPHLHNAFHSLHVYVQLVFIIIFHRNACPMLC